MSVDNVINIRRIYDDPLHRHYGPARRLWMMFEQMFADQFGGFNGLQAKLDAVQERQPMGLRRWDEHLVRLLDGGQREPAAQRMVMIQMLFAAERLS